MSHITEPDLKLVAANVRTLLADVPEPRHGIAKFYIPGLRHIYLQPDHSITSGFMHHKAMAGLLWSNQWHLPVGTEAYAYWRSDTPLEEAGRSTLTWLVLKAAWCGPFLTHKHRKYQFTQAVGVTLVVLLFHPLYELGWQGRKYWWKLKDKWLG